MILVPRGWIVCFQALVKIKLLKGLPPFRFLAAPKVTIALTNAGRQPIDQLLIRGTPTPDQKQGGRGEGRPHLGTIRPPPTLWRGHDP